MKRNRYILRQTAPHVAYVEFFFSFLYRSTVPSQWRAFMADTILVHGSGHTVFLSLHYPFIENSGAPRKLILSTLHWDF